MAQPAAASRPQGFGTILRNPFFTRLWTAQIISQTVQNATNYGAIILLSQQSGGSVTAVGGVVIAFSLPAVIFGVPAGVLVDRFDKRTLLWVSNLVRGLLTLGFVFSFQFFPKAYVPTYLLTFGISIVGQFFAPAEGASIPLLVGEDELVPALSLFNITFSVSQAIGYVLLAPLVLVFAPNTTLFSGMVTITSTDWLFLLIGVCYLVCAGLTASIPAARLVGQPAPSASQTSRRMASMWAGVREAGHFVRHDRKLLIAVLQLTLGSVVISAISIIAPDVAQKFLHQPATLAAIFFVPAGIGLVLGSVFMPRIINRIGLVISEALGVVGVSICTVLLTFAHWAAQQLQPDDWWKSAPYLLSIMLLTFGIGLSLDLVTLPAQTVMQRRSPDWIKGRVLALQMMLVNAAAIPIILFIGSVSDFLGLPVAMNLLAVSVAVLGLGSVILQERHGAHSTTPTGPLRHRLNGAQDPNSTNPRTLAQQKTRTTEDAIKDALSAAKQSENGEQSTTPSRPLTTGER